MVATPHCRAWLGTDTMSNVSLPFTIPGDSWEVVLKHRDAVRDDFSYPVIIFLCPLDVSSVTQKPGDGLAGS
jgi:hypothetical protein